MDLCWQSDICYFNTQYRFVTTFLPRKDPECMATYSSIPAWGILWTEESGGVQSMGFLPHSASLLIWWLESSSTVILEPKKIKSVTISIVFLSICHEVMGLDAMIFVS